MITRILKSSLMAVISLCITSCSLPAIRANDMLPMTNLYTSMDVNEELNGAIALGQISVDKGRGGSAYAQITAKEFRDALTNALLMAGYAKRGNGKPLYLLNANILNIDYPLMGISMKVTSKIHYLLKSTEDNSVVYNETLVLPYTANLVNHLMGLKD